MRRLMCTQDSLEDHPFLCCITSRIHLIHFTSFHHPIPTLVLRLSRDFVCRGLVAVWCWVKDALEIHLELIIWLKTKRKTNENITKCFICCSLKSCEKIVFPPKHLDLILGLVDVALCSTCLRSVLTMNGKLISLRVFSERGKRHFTNSTVFAHILLPKRFLSRAVGEALEDGHTRRRSGSSLLDNAMSMLMESREKLHQRKTLTTNCDIFKARSCKICRREEICVYQVKRFIIVKYLNL